MTHIAMVKGRSTMNSIFMYFVGLMEVVMGLLLKAVFCAIAIAGIILYAWLVVWIALLLTEKVVFEHLANFAGSDSGFVWALSLCISLSIVPAAMMAVISSKSHFDAMVKVGRSRLSEGASE